MTTAQLVETSVTPTFFVKTMLGLFTRTFIYLKVFVLPLLSIDSSN